MSHKKKVIASVVVPSYNSRGTIVSCLESILSQNVEFEFETIVIDSSEDDTAAILTERFPQVKVINSEQRLSPAEARNIGVKVASGSIIAFIDADCIACQAWLERIRQRHQLEYIAIGGAIINGNPGSILGWAEYFLEFTEFLPFSPRRQVRTIPTCNISYKKKEVFEQYGFFPEVRTAEDALFNWFLVKSGEKILFDPSIIVKHLHNRKFEAFLRNQYILGEGFAESRSQKEMPGNFALKYFWPLLFIARLFLIFKRVAAWNRQVFIKLIKSLPIVIVGLIVWQYGVFHMYCCNKSC